MKMNYFSRLQRGRPAKLMVDIDQWVKLSYQDIMSAITQRLLDINTRQSWTLSHHLMTRDEVVTELVSLRGRPSILRSRQYGSSNNLDCGHLIFSRVKIQSCEWEMLQVLQTRGLNNRVQPWAAPPVLTHLGRALLCPPPVTQVQAGWGEESVGGDLIEVLVMVRRQFAGAGQLRSQVPGAGLVSNIGLHWWPDHVTSEQCLMLRQPATQDKQIIYCLLTWQIGSQLLVFITRVTSHS